MHSIYLFWEIIIYSQNLSFERYIFLFIEKKEREQGNKPNLYIRKHLCAHSKWIIKQTIR